MSTPTSQAKPRRKKLARVVLPVLSLWLAYALVVQLGVAWEDRSAERDPDTDIRLGAEALWLGPEDAQRAVLFVHGFVGGSNNFGETPQKIAAQGWRVRVMLLPGHGTSPREFAQKRPEDLLNAVREELRALKIQHETVVLAGHSMGGALSTIMAAKEKPDGLILAAPYFGVTHHWYYGLRPEQWTRLASPFLPYVYKGTLFLQVNRKEAKKEIFSYTWIPMKGALTLTTLGEMARNDGVLSEVICPVLLIHSRGDVAASPEATETAFSKMAAKEKTLRWLERSNHHIFWDHEREDVSEAILSFLETLK
jgi:carboxylesterase